MLKGTLRIWSGARFFRQGLVVFQFVLSMLLIVGTIIVYRQVNYVQTTNLGYERENLIYVPVEGELTASRATKRLRMSCFGSPAFWPYRPCRKRPPTSAAARAG